MGKFENRTLVPVSSVESFSKKTKKRPRIRPLFTYDKNGVYVEKEEKIHGYDGK